MPDPVLSVCACAACAPNCSRCDASDRGSGKCNDDGCNPGYTIDKGIKICVPGECH